MFHMRGLSGGGRGLCQRLGSDLYRHRFVGRIGMMMVVVRAVIRRTAGRPNERDEGKPALLHDDLQ